jgi:hypothetical protein
MSLATRLEKLRFLVQELELAAVIARAQPTDYFRRVLSRRVLVRARDFATHARQIWRPARKAGYDLSQFRRRKEVYAKTFEEYFQEQRDRLCAHVQDIDWARRLELWTDIEAAKMNYFVDGAREVYEALGEVGIVGYQPYEPFPEVTDIEFGDALARDAVDHAPTPGVKMGVDILAATRPNTSVALNFHPLHQRAGQLAAIADWLQREVELYEGIERWRNAQRLCRAQIVTDVVSYADCLVTRGGPGQGQQLTGLDGLMRDAGFAIPTPVDEFLRVFRFEEKLSLIRGVRDRVAAHLHDDDKTDLASLLRDLDEISPIEVLRFYDKMWMVFATACRRDIRLRMYERNDQRMFGVVSLHGGQEHVKPFDERSPSPPPPTFTEKRDFTEQGINQAIQAWMVGGVASEGARHYLWNAFGNSPTVERCERNGRPFDVHVAHNVLLGRLVDASSPTEVGRLLDLAASCGNGWPQPLAEMLLRFREALHQRGEFRYDGAICWALGALPPGEDDWIDVALLEGTQSTGAHAARLAIAAFYKRLMGLRSGPANREPRRGMYVNHVASLVASRPQRERLCVLLQLGGLFSGGRLTATHKEIEIEYPIVQAAVATEILSVFRDTEGKETASVFLRQHDYVSLAVLVAERLRGDGDAQTASELVEAVSVGEISMPVDYEHRAQPQANLALALLHTGRFEEAKRTAAAVMRNYPAAIGLKLRCLWILARAGHPAAACREMLEYVRASYVLSPDLEKMAVTINEVLTESVANARPQEEQK